MFNDVIILDNTIMTLTLVLSSIMLVMLAVYVYMSGQQSRVMGWFVAILFLLLIWNLAYLFRLFVASGKTQWFLFKLEGIAVVCLGPVILSMSRAYRGWHKRHSFVVGLAYVAAGAMIVYSLSPFPNQLFLGLIANGDLTYGPVSYYIGAFMLVCLLGAAYYFSTGVENPSVYWRNQVTYIGGAGLLAFVAAALEMWGIVPINMNLSLLLLPVVLMLLITAVMKYQFLDILPFTVTEALNYIEDGYIVFDKNGHLEDHRLTILEGVLAIESCQTIDDLLEAFDLVISNKVSLLNLKSALDVTGDRYIIGELRMTVDTYPIHLQYIAKAISDKVGMKIATMVAFHDMTELQVLYKTLDSRQVELMEAREKLEHHIRTVRELSMETERNGLMAEINDTLGHSMAEVLAILEKCDMILREEEADEEGAVEAIELALDKSRASLAEIRAAVTKFKRMGVER